MLDTHIALWALTQDRRLSARARAMIADLENEVFVSVASLWEVAIKRRSARKSIPPVSSVEAARYFAEAGYRLLAISADHAVAVEDLPAIHADPFDRIMIAQALTEPMRLMTHDDKVARYSDTILLV